MSLDYGATVEDKNNKLLGTIDHIVMDTWSGEQRKFLVRRDAPLKDIFFAPDHVASATGNKVKLSVSVEELENE